jgi:hypothetical protein
MKTTKTAVLLALVLASASLQAHELSTRGNVGTGDNVMIGGLIVEEQDCDQYGPDGQERVAAFVIRVLGPSLVSAGLTNVLQDPQIAFYNEQGDLIGGQMDYTENDIATQQIIYDHNLAPTDVREVALFVRIPAGFYTAICSGQHGGTGIALLEAYKL